MCSRKSLDEILLTPPLTFTCPTFHSKKESYVDFFAFDKATGKMRRKKYSLNRIKNKKARRAYAEELVFALLTKLRYGWSPWQNVASFRPETLLSEAFELYKKVNSRNLTDKSVKTNNSFLRKFSEFLSTRQPAVRLVSEITTALITDFLDDIYLNGNVSARTVNNYRGWLHGLCTFFISRQYLSSNPVTQIRELREQPKERQPLTPAMLTELRSYLREKNPRFLLACMMEYYTFIRPKELLDIKLGDISIMEQSVFVSGRISKNHRDGKVALNAELIKMMIDLNVFSYPTSCYLFGKGFRPSQTRGENQQFARAWTKVRAALKWKSEYKFYSLKDSGIRDLANQEGIIVARDQARHTDIATTNKYLQGRDIPVHDEVKHFKGGL